MNISSVMSRWHAHLHGPVVDFDTIQLSCGLRRGLRIGEDDRGNPAALSSRSVSKEDLLRGSNHLAKVVLNQSRVSGLL